MATKTTTAAAPAAADAAAPAAAGGLLDSMLDGFTPTAVDDVKQAINLLIGHIEQTDVNLIPRNTDLNIRAIQAAIDQKLSAQLNEILHHPKYQALEGTWRGLHYLVQSTTTSEFLKLKVLNVKKETLRQDFEDEVEFDQGLLWKKVYEAEYGQLGGHPFGMMVSDFEFNGQVNTDVDMLKKLSGVAAAAHAPLVAGTNPKMFDMKSFTELNNPRDLAKTFEQKEYTNWRDFRSRHNSRYVALTLPRVLARLPYGDNEIDPTTQPARGFTYHEAVDGSDHSKYQWMSAAWAYAARVTDAFAEDGWFMRTRGMEAGGVVTDLPVHVYSDAGGKEVKCPTEVMIPDRRSAELDDLGFLPLMFEKNSNKAVFMGSQSTQRPKTFPNTPDGKLAEASAQLSARLSYTLCVSRFAHYLKVIARDAIGSFKDRDRMQSWLNDWIEQYKHPSPHNASDEGLAAKPLREARVEVEAVPGRPGEYQAVAYLKPHFQFEKLDMSLRLVAELPKKAGG